MSGKKDHGVLGTSNNVLEEEIAERIAPLLTESDIERISEKKLTLNGCMEYCMKNGHKYEVRKDKNGVAMISPEQHWKWVSEYFGVDIRLVPESINLPEEQAEQESVDDTLSALLDF